MTVRRLTAQCLPPLRNKRNSTGDCHAAEFQTGRCRRWVNPGFHPWGPHVRFRRVQTLVREGSPLVNLRNSA